MPDLAMELSHLELADRHIAEGRVRLAEATERSKETASPVDSVGTMTETLAAVESHRLLILQTIADIRSGKV